MKNNRVMTFSIWTFDAKMTLTFWVLNIQQHSDEIFHQLNLTYLHFFFWRLCEIRAWIAMIMFCSAFVHDSMLAFLKRSYNTSYSVQELLKFTSTIFCFNKMINIFLVMSWTDVPLFELGIHYLPRAKTTPSIVCRLVQWICNKRFPCRRVSQVTKMQITTQSRQDILAVCLSYSRKGHLNLHSPVCVPVSYLASFNYGLTGVGLSSPSVDGGCKLFAFLFFCRLV